MDELELITGTHVYCKNGKCGRLSKVVVDPAAWRVTSIIVEDGFLQRYSRVFPISAVTQDTFGNIHLSIAEDELGAYPEYVEEVGLVELPEGIVVTEADGDSEGKPTLPATQIFPENRRQASSPDLYVIERGTPIGHLDSALGRLDYFLVQSGDGQIRGLVMQQPAIPPSVVRHIDAHLISLGAEPAESERSRRA